jgi:dihydropteroate synthase
MQKCPNAGSRFLIPKNLPHSASMNDHFSLTRSQLAGLEVGDGIPVRIMGVLNVSPESFYQGSVHDNPARLIEAARAMADAGAHIIDIGAMSTAPYLKTLISEEEETARLSWAVSAVAAQVNVPVSADTKRASAARAALNCGARIINDVSGLKHDPAMATLIATSGAGAILMASEPVPRSGPPLERTLRALHENVEIATQAGVSRSQIVLDPGIGFFRQPGIPWDEWDCLVLRELGQLRQLGLPLLVGASRKSFIGKILDQANPTDRLIGSVACAAIAVYNGAHIIRAHDVKETVEAVRMAERLRPVLPLSGSTG